MVQLSATRCSCIAILWVSLVSLAAITLCDASQRVFIVVYFVITQPGNFWIQPRMSCSGSSASARCSMCSERKTFGRYWVWTPSAWREWGKPLRKLAFSWIRQYVYHILFIDYCHFQTPSGSRLLHCSSLNNQSVSTHNFRNNTQYFTTLKTRTKGEGECNWQGLRPVTLKVSDPPL
jgi:hypothetical protein